MDGLTDTPRTRAPLFRRVEPDPFRLTERDIDFLEAVGRYGTVQSTHLELLFPDASPQHLRRRLKCLFHAGLLARPEVQRAYLLDYSGFRSLAYLLTERGAAVVAERRGVRFAFKQADLKVSQLAHRLETTDVVVGMEVACRRSEYLALETFPDILARAPNDTRTALIPDRWQVTITHRGTSHTFHVQPDGIVTICHTHAAQENDPRARKHFFLEIDRGTMAIERSTLFQTSIFRKYLCYAATFRDGIHRNRFGMNNMRVLFIGKSRKRIDAMIHVFGERLTGIASPRLFLFADRPTLFAKEQPFLDYLWRDGEGEEHTLFE